MTERMALCCGNDAAAWQPLNGRQRWARLIVGVALLTLTLALPWSTVGWITLAIIVGWVAVTHVLAAATGYPGCPELGAVPSLCIGRWVKIGCGPWRWLDAKLRLTAE
jgi:hypothetical protein